MPDLYIMKLGGSVITAKEENKFEAKEKLLEQIGSEIKKALKKKKFFLVLVHGAGPFGHTNVSEYGIDNGVFTERQKKGLEKTIKDCNFLDSIAVKKMREAGLSAIGFDANKLVVQEEKKIIKFDCKAIQKALKEGKIPVLYGQMVPDKKLNASVVSGDAIIAFLAKKLNAKKIFLGTDVAGVFTADPKKDKKAKKIELINKKNFDKIIEKAGESTATDVTQGMKGKLMKIRQMPAGIETIVFDAAKQENVYKALVGEKIEGTEIRL